MTIVDKQSVSDLRLSRVISFALLALCFVIRLLYGGENVKFILIDICFSCSLIFMLPVWLGYGLNRVIVIVSFSSADILLAIASSSGFFPDHYAAMAIYSVLIVFPLVLGIVLRIFRWMKNDEYMNATLSGEECSIEYTFLFHSMLCTLLFILVANTLEKNFMFHNALLIIMLVLSFAYLSFRNYSLLQKRTVTALTEHSDKQIEVPPPFSVEDNIDVKYKVLYRRMCEIMDENKPYLNPEYTIDDLAKSLYTNRGYLSKMINICTKSNFSLLMNTYRIRYAVELFRQNPKLKVSELSETSGFRNGVTFNTSFKLIMNGLTPGLWCEMERKRITECRHLSMSEVRAP